MCKPATPLLQTVVLRCLVLLLALMVASCGGSQLAGGVGSGGSGLAEGAVSGFGSVIVDGVAYGDLQATVEREGEPGIAEVKLGQRVRVTHEGGQASRIVVVAQLAGVADSAPDAQGLFTLLGQRVRIVSAQDTAGPPTYFDGLSQLRAGDAVEVHGSWSRSAGLPLLLASRIEKLSAAPETVLLTAPVLSRSGNVLRLDDARQTQVQAQEVPASLKAGSLLRARISRDALAQAPWSATQLADAGPDLATEQTLSLSGVAAPDEAGPSWLRVEGLSVRLPASAETAPAPGTPVQVQLRREGGQWVAQSLTAQTLAGQPLVRLKGVIPWNVSAGLLRMRGTTVEVDNAALAPSCQGIAAGAEVLVVVDARRGPPGQPPVATSVDCSTSAAKDEVLEAQGLLLQIQADSLTVQVRGSPLTLVRTERSLLPRDWAGWQGRAVEVEYQRSGSSYLLRKLKPQRE